MMRHSLTLLLITMALLATLGAPAARIHDGERSSKTVARGVKSELQAPGALVGKRGAPSCLLSDSAKVQIQKHAHDIHQARSIKDFQCEPERQRQNFAEGKTGGDLKSGSPAASWTAVTLLLSTVSPL